MKWLPKTLAGQLLSLLLLGLLVSHIFFHLGSGKTEGSIHKVSQDQTIEQFATARRLFMVCNRKCDPTPLLAALENEFSTFSLTHLPSEAMDEEETSFANLLASKLGTPVGIQIREPDPRTGQQSARSVSITAIMPLPDGRLLQGKIWPVVRRSSWRPVGFTIMASAIPILLLVVLFARHLLKPLRSLTEAAERISRGERVTVPEHGPREVREVATAFNAMQERLTHFLAERTHMLAAISHDLRTPITSLRLRVEMIDDVPLRTAMIRTLDDMRQMVEETLTLTHADSQHEHTIPLDLGHFIELIGQEQFALGRNVSWEPMPNLPYRGRAVVLARAFNNLIENAVRYGGNAHISLDLAEEIEIRIEDNGPGLPDVWLKKVFEPFARPDRNRSRNTGGVGLGLAIARSAIEAHGGKITLHNRVSGGLCARISLPPLHTGAGWNFGDLRPHQQSSLRSPSSEQEINNQLMF